MTPNQPNVRARTPQNDVINKITARNPGPYLAKVVSHLDKKFSGSLLVEILKNSVPGNTPESETELVIARYASPFYGVTSLEFNDSNDSYYTTQKSYGFWAVPPDVGTKVLVSFVEGDPGHAYWFACVQDDNMNFMIPDGRAATALTTPATPPNLAGKRLPVGEYNKFLANPNNNYPTSQPKPFNPEFTSTLLGQGLLEDDVRGLTTTSARREAPSNVFGMSTPGPIDKRQGAPTGAKGPRDAKATTFVNRLGGSSIVMDDGDEKILRKGSPTSTPSEYANLSNNEGGGDPTRPANELFRIRTRTGHQILLHNTEDLIYIGNARGTTWIELTSNGKIDIFANDSISIHTAQDLNVTADRDINFTAYENMNIVVGKELRVDVGERLGMTSGKDTSINSGEGVSLTAATFLSGYASDSVTLIANSGMSILSNSDLSIGSTAQIGIEGCNGIRLSTDGDLHQKALGSLYTETTGDINQKAGQRMLISTGSVFGVGAGGNIILKATSEIKLNSDTPPTPGDVQLPAKADPVVPTDPARAFMAARVPDHEPWYQHENVNPAAYGPDRTRAGFQQVNSFTTPGPDPFVPPSVAQQAATINTSYYPQYDAGTANNNPVYSNSPNVGAYKGTPGAPMSISQLVGVIDGFTKEQTAAYLGALGKRESNNAYDAVNTLGYCGKYQFGLGALEDGGYIKSGSAQQYRNSSTSNAALWTGKNGCSSREAWLTNANAQELAMIEYTNRNLKTLKRIGGIASTDNIPYQAGMLAGSHLLGAGGMKKWRQGLGGSDAYGTTGDEYFSLGQTAVKNAGTSSSNNTISNNSGGGPQ